MECALMSSIIACGILIIPEPFKGMFTMETRRIRRKTKLRDRKFRVNDVLRSSGLNDFHLVLLKIFLFFRCALRVSVVNEDFICSRGHKPSARPARPLLP